MKRKYHMFIVSVMVFLPSLFALHLPNYLPLSPSCFSLFSLVVYLSFWLSSSQPPLYVSFSILNPPCILHLVYNNAGGELVLNPFVIRAF